MSDLPGVTITGASGRMGQTLTGLVNASERMRLVGAVERSGHPWIGQDVGVAMGGPPLGVVVTDDPLQACLLYTSPSPRDRQKSRMPSSA